VSAEKGESVVSAEKGESIVSAEKEESIVSAEKGVYKRWLLTSCSDKNLGRRPQKKV
jgi:hypothetical protein